jgi:hypothetical protein
MLCYYGFLRTSSCTLHSIFIRPSISWNVFVIFFNTTVLLNQQLPLLLTHDTLLTITYDLTCFWEERSQFIYGLGSCSCSESFSFYWKVATLTNTSS